MCKKHLFSFCSKNDALNDTFPMNLCVCLNSSLSARLELKYLQEM